MTMQGTTVYTFPTVYNHGRGQGPSQKGTDALCPVLRQLSPPLFQLLYGIGIQID